MNLPEGIRIVIDPTLPAGTVILMPPPEYADDEEQPTAYMRQFGMITGIATTKDDA